MAENRRDRKLFLSAVFFAFGAICGIMTGKFASASLAAATAENVFCYFSSSVPAASVLAAMAVPLLLILLSMTLFGAILILPCVLLAGGAAGWAICCLIRCGVDTAALYPLLCAWAPQLPCLMFIAASCLRLSVSIRSMVTRGGLRRPDIGTELRLLAVSLIVKLLAAVLLAMLLRRWKLF